MVDRIMWIMRGLPGSGKSTLAREIAEVNAAVICSADNYFIVNGKYMFDQAKLGEAHAWCKGMARGLMEARCQLIIDNTNIRLRELAPYLLLANEYGYRAMIRVPTTPWAWDPEACFSRTVHGVPYGVIKRMKDCYEPWVAVEVNADLRDRVSA